jgi:ABC-type multidrug transport system ATPase subunit
MADVQIKVEGLSKRFNREWIFRDLTFHFQSDKIYAITGPNGSGKSTLLQILWGQMPPSSGTITYFSGDDKIPDEHIYQLVSIATPYMDLIEEFTLQEQLEFHFKTRRVKTAYTVAQIIEALYLEEATDKYISNFSSGMKQRLKLGLAFYTDSPVLFLDEPGTNLDERAFAWYTEHLEKFRPGKLVFIASNQPDEYPAEAEKLNLSEFKKPAEKVG